MARIGLLPRRAAVGRPVGFPAEPGFGQCNRPGRAAGGIAQRCSAGCWGRGTAFPAGRSSICHLTEGTEMGDPNYHKISSYPIGLHLQSFCKAGWKRLLLYRLSFFLGGRATLPALQRRVPTLLSQCPTYFLNPGVMALSPCLSKWFQSVQQLQMNKSEVHCDNISRFPLCMAENLFISVQEIYLFRKAPQPSSCTCFTSATQLPDVAIPPTPPPGAQLQNKLLSPLAALLPVTTSLTSSGLLKKVLEKSLFAQTMHRAPAIGVVWFLFFFHFQYCTSVRGFIRFSIKTFQINVPAE